MVVADGAPGAGHGHLARCSGVIAALDRAQAPATALALDSAVDRELDGVPWAAATEAEAGAAIAGAIVIGDTYRLEPAWFRDLAPRALVWFADDGRRRPAADLTVISPRTPDPPVAGVLGGFEHVSLRPAMAPRPRPWAPTVTRVLVSFGMTALFPVDRLASEIARELPQVEVRVAGPAGGRTPAASLAEELPAAQIVVCAGGQTALEVVAWGLPCVVLPIVDNQAQNVRALASAGAVVVASGPQDAVRHVRDLAGDAARRRALSAATAQAIDGRGADRIAAAVLRLAEDAR